MAALQQALLSAVAADGHHVHGFYNNSLIAITLPARTPAFDLPDTAAANVGRGRAFVQALGFF